MRLIKVLKKSKGFTLIELMIVICVIGIMVAVAGPNIKNWTHNARLKSAARDLYSNLQKAKTGAIKSNREYAIVFNTTNNSYQLVNGGENGEYDGTPVPQDDDQVEQTVSLSSYGSGVKYGHGSATINATVSGGDTFPDDEISHTGNKIVFTANGMVNEQGYIYLSNDSNELSYAVATPTIAGVITMKKWSGTTWQ